MSLPATPPVTGKDPVPTHASFSIGTDFLLGYMHMPRNTLSDLSCHLADIGACREVGAIVGRGEANGFRRGRGRREGEGESRLRSCLSCLSPRFRALSHEEAVDESFNPVPGFHLCCDKIP